MSQHGGGTKETGPQAVLFKLGPFKRSKSPSLEEEKNVSRIIGFCCDCVNPKFADNALVHHVDG